MRSSRTLRVFLARRGLLAQLRAGGVEIIGGPESHENGKFAWIVDPDGNKVELWEPKAWNQKHERA